MLDSFRGRLMFSSPREKNYTRSGIDWPSHQNHFSNICFETNSRLTSCKTDTDRELETEMSILQTKSATALFQDVNFEARKLGLVAFLGNMCTTLWRRVIW